MSALQQIDREFAGESVTFLQRDDGEVLITAQCIGACLGFSDPRKQISKLYDRHMDELIEHKAGVKVTTPSGVQEVTTFTEQGAFLLSMFARTEKAKEWRAWLSRTCTELRRGDKVLVDRDHYEGLVTIARETAGSLPALGRALGAAAKMGASVLASYGHAKRRHPELFGQRTNQLRFEFYEEVEFDPQLDGEVTS